APRLPGGGELLPVLQRREDHPHPLRREVAGGGAHPAGPLLHPFLRSVHHARRRDAQSGAPRPLLAGDRSAQPRLARRLRHLVYPTVGSAGNGSGELPADRQPGHGLGGGAGLRSAVPWAAGGSGAALPDPLAVLRPRRLAGARGFLAALRRLARRRGAGRRPAGGALLAAVPHFLLSLEGGYERMAWCLRRAVSFLLSLFSCSS